MSLIFDIETIGEDFESMDTVTQLNLTRWIKREAGEDEDKYNAKIAELKEGLGFSPLTGAIAAIGVYDSEKNKGVVFYQAPDQNSGEEKDENFIFKSRTEKAMLENFWQGAKNYQELVSFNGRSFDVPFLVTRSAKYQIKPTIDLMSNRYLYSQRSDVKHIDLLDQFSFYGAFRKRGSLHLYCRAFGIKSPKASGINGGDVKRLFQEKKYREIAEYNSWDLIATWELFKIWQEYFKI